MKRMITKCPGCQGTLHIAKLQCPDCGMELKNDFSLSRFDRLDDAQYEFLLTFLKSRGSLKEVQAELQLSYPAAKKGVKRIQWLVRLRCIVDMNWVHPFMILFL